MKTAFHHISDLLASEDETNQELAFLLLSSYEVPLWLALQIGFQYLHANRPEYAENFINQYFTSEEEREKMWAATRFFYFPEWKTVWHSENIYSGTDLQVRKYAAAFRHFLPDYAILCAYRSEFLHHFSQSVAICYAYYECCNYSQFPDADFWLQTAIDWKSENTDLWFYLAEFQLKNPNVHIYDSPLLLRNPHFNLNNFEKAETLLLQYLELVPNTVLDNYYKLDEFYHDLYRYFPDTLQAYNLLISLYADFQPFRNIEKALEYCQKAIELAPNHYQAPYVRYAELLLENPEFPRTEILNLYKKQLENQEFIRPVSDPQNNFYRRKSLYQQQKKQNISLYEKMLSVAEKLNNCNEILHACKMSQNWEKQLVTVLEKKGDYWQAEVLIDKILKKNPQNATALHWKPIVEDKIYRLK